MPDESPSYIGYFKAHFGSQFDRSDLIKYQKSFYGQWRFLQQALAPRTLDSVFEIGSGLGGFRAFLAKETVYAGLELDADAAAFCNAYFGDEAVLTEPIETFEPTQLYDAVCAFEVLEHLSDPGPAIEKSLAMLKPGGVFFGTSPFPYLKNVLADDTHVSVLHPANWRRRFELAGFSSVTTSAMSFLPSVWRLDRRLNVRLPFYTSLPGFISTCLIVAVK